MHTGMIVLPTMAIADRQFSDTDLKKNEDGRL